MTDALVLLKQDHKTVEQLFKRYEKTTAPKERRSIVDRIISELSVHAAIEEQHFYPAVREALPDISDEVLEGLEEHHVLKWTLHELLTLPATDERFHAKVTVLIEQVRHHVKEEEGDMFPQVREGMTRKPLQELGAALEKAKKTAPTKPHPRAPDEPTGNLITGPVARVVDLVTDRVTGAAR